jgi:hypothetical protein
MTPDLADLIRQRDDLTARIAAASSSADEAYAGEMALLRDVTVNVAADLLLPVAERDRGNVRSLILDGWLTVELGYPGPGRSPFLAVRTRSGVTADFEGQLPPPAALAGYLHGLVEHDRERNGPEAHEGDAR